MRELHKSYAWGWVAPFTCHWMLHAWSCLYYQSDPNFVSDRVVWLVVGCQTSICAWTFMRCDWREPKKYGRMWCECIAALHWYLLAFNNSPVCSTEKNTTVTYIAHLGSELAQGVRVGQNVEYQSWNTSKIIEMDAWTTINRRYGDTKA